VITDPPIRRHPDHWNVVRGVNPMPVYDRRATLIVNHYYWDYYYVNGISYRWCYLWDGSYLWGGFYFGSHYYWTRWHYNRWWWHDPAWGRWCYWHDGYWWWEHPYTRAIYVYRDGYYYIYRETPRGEPVLRPDPERPADPQLPPVDPNQTVFYSNDGTRMVQVLGATRHAHLYSYPEAQYLADLGDRVIGDDKNTQEVESGVAFVYDNAGKADLIIVRRETTNAQTGQTEIKNFYYTANGLPLWSQTASPQSLRQGPPLAELGGTAGPPEAGAPARGGAPAVARGSQ